MVTTVSICLLGRYDETEPADILHLDALNGQALIRLCLWLLQEIGASPGQVVPVAAHPDDTCQSARHRAVPPRHCWSL